MIIIKWKIIEKTQTFKNFIIFRSKKKIKQSTKIKRDEINIMNIINDNLLICMIAS